MFHLIRHILDQYGYIVLFVSLLLELLALPLPGEVLMSYCGFLVFSGQLNLYGSILSATGGVAVGITLSYLLGAKLGYPFFRKYGPRIHLSPERLDMTSRWFERYGNKLLLFAYFIPGVRHFTGYFSGITRIPYPAFALYSYLGALIWTSTFILLGRTLGPKWQEFEGAVSHYLVIGGAVLVVALLLFLLYRSYKQQIYAKIGQILEKALKALQSLGKLEALLLGLGLLFIVLSGLMIGFMTEYLEKDLIRFDTIVRYVVSALFGPEWTESMTFFTRLASVPALVGVTALAWVWIVVKGSDRVLETGFLLFTIVAGELLEESFHRFFHRVGSPSGLAPPEWGIPSEQSMVALYVYGSAVFLLMRHSRPKWIRPIASLALLVILLLTAISRIFLNIQLPSDIAAGMVLGGTWLLFNLILLEIFRRLRQIGSNNLTGNR
ncbi:VTT domain-containing protein [Effusibacillus dendaii]|uniref:Alkaline phosphatase n=1 Tax=Effusibacillus dendaii TaxID=2743772 RepID=A0A7I8DEQ6_9BACL|nr:VTT domain-containing protein [Effusibacillus dendaii]BCJ87772.1 hypothetical protein skT53_27570 [Effusibacillus dendaii]